MNNNILDFDEINEMLMKDEKRQNNYRTGELDEDSKILERFTSKYKPALQNFYDSSDDPKGERFKVETAQLISSNTGINFDRAYSYLDMLGGDIYNRDIDPQGVMEGFINSVKEAHYTRLNGKAMTKWEITGNDKYLKQADEYNEEALKHHVHDDYNLLGDLFIASAQPAYSVSRFLINDLAIKGSAFAISTILGGGVPFAAIAGTKAVDLASKAYNLYDSGTVQAGNTYYNLSKIEDADGNKLDLQSPFGKTAFAMMSFVQGFIEVGSMEFLPVYTKLQQAIGSKTMSNALSKGIKNKLLHFGAEYLQPIVSESGEEGMQSIVEDLTSDLLKYHENKIKDAGFELADAKDILDKSFKSMLEAAKSMVLFGAISGGVGNGAIGIRARVDANKSYKSFKPSEILKGKEPKTIDSRYVVNDSHEGDENFEKDVQAKLKNINKKKLDIPTGVAVGMSVRPKTREDSVLIEAGLRNGSKFLKMNVGEFDAATADVQQDMLNAYAYRFGGQIDNKTNTINIPNKEVYNYSINQLAKDSYDLQKNEDNSYSFKLRDHSGKAFTINIKSDEKPSKEYIEPDSTKASELSLPSFMKSIMKAKTDLTISPEIQTSLKKKYSNILSKKEISNVAGLYNVLSKGTGKSVSELDNIIEFRFETNEEINNVAMQSLLSQGLSQEEATSKLNSKIYRGYHSVQEGKQVITLTPNKNATTIFHEMGHVFSNLLSPEQKEVFTKAYNGVSGAMWASDIQKENNQFKLGDNVYESFDEAFNQIVPNEERFADDFVAYVSTGVAASEELKSIFDKFKEFLTEFINVFRSRLSDSTIKAFDEILNSANREYNHPLDVWKTSPGFDDIFSISREGKNNLTRNTSPSAYSTFSNSNNNVTEFNLQDSPSFQSEELELTKKKYDISSNYVIEHDGSKKYLAPNGQISNLSGDLYFKVRTPSFKKWFGDWELQSKIKWLFNSENVIKLNKDTFQKNQNYSLVEQVNKFYNDNFDSKIERVDIGVILLTKRSIQSSIAHGIGRNKAIAFKAVPEVITKGKIFMESENYKNRGYKAYVIEAPINIDSKDYICEVVINQSQNNNHFYLHEIELKEKLLDGYQVRTNIDTNLKRKTLQGASRLILSKYISGVNDISKAIDENGEPLVVYHGTNKDFEEFKKDKQNQYSQYGGGFFFTEEKEIAIGYGDRIQSVFLNARNGMNEKRLAKKNGEPIPKVDHIHNKKDRGIWIVYEPNQIKSINNTGAFNPNNNSILYHSEDKQTQVLDNKGTLVAMHNISEANLVNSYELGGLPMPSIAITKPSISHDGFGDITLLGDKALGNELIEKGVVWNKDIWSPTVPRPTYRVNAIELELKLDELNNDTTLHIDPKLLTRRLDNENFTKDDAEEIASYISESVNYNGLVESFFKSKNIPLRIPYRTMNSDLKNGSIVNKSSAMIIKAMQAQDITDVTFLDLEQVLPTEMYKEKWEKLSKVFKKWKDNLEGFAQNYRDLAVKQLEWYERSFYTTDKANIKIDTEALQKRIDNKFTKKLKEDYKSWLKELISPYWSEKFIETENGNNLPFTAEGILIYMENQTLNGNSSGSMTYSYNLARSLSARRLNTREELSQNENKLQDSLDQDDNTSKLKDLYMNMSYENAIDKDSYSILDNSSHAIADYLNKVDKPSKAEMKRQLKRQGFFIESQEFVNTAVNFAESLRNQTRKYFEAKPKTIVQPSDFVAAIVPESTSTKLVETLREDGLQVEFYNNNRQEVLNNFINNNENSILFQSDNIIDIFDKNFKENKKSLDLFETNLMNLNINQRFKPNTYFKILEHTPLIFKELGYADKPFVIYKSKIAQILSTEKISNGTPRGKAIDKKIMIDAFKAISNPVAVFNSVRKNKINNKYEKVKDQFVILVDILDKFNNGIIIPIHLEKNISNIKVNIISSVYGKDNTQKYVLNNLKNNNLVYLDKNKSDYVAFMPNFYGGNSSRLSDSVNTVLTKEDIVNQYHFDEGQNLYQSDNIIDSIDKNFIENRNNFKNFENDLNNYDETKKGKPHERFIVFKIMPLIFRELGYNPKPLILYKSKIHLLLSNKEIKGKNTHGDSLNKKLLIKALSNISDPEGIYHSVNFKTGEMLKHQYVVTVGIKDKLGNEILVILHFDAKRNNTEIYKIASVYGKNNIEKYLNKIEKYQVYSKYNNKTSSVPQDKLQLLSRSTVTSSKLSVIRRDDIVNKYHLKPENRLYQSEQKNTREAPAGDIQYVRVVSSSSSIYNIITKDDIVNKYNLDRNQKLWQSEPEEKDSIFNNFELSDIEEALNKNFYIPSSALYPLIDKSEVVRKEIDLRKDLAAFPWILDEARLCDTLDEFLQHIKTSTYEDSLEIKLDEREGFYNNFPNDTKSQRALAVKIFELSRIITPKQSDRIFLSNNATDKYDVLNLANNLNQKYEDVINGKVVTKQPLFKGISPSVLAINEESTKDQVQQAINLIKQNPRAYRQALIVKQQAEQRVKRIRGDNDISDISDRLVFSEMFLDDENIDEELSNYSDFKNVKIDEDIKDKNLTNIELSEDYLLKQLDELNAKDKELSQVKKEVKNLEKQISEFKNKDESNQNYKRELSKTNTQLKKANHTIELLKQQEINRKARIARDNLIKHISSFSNFNDKIHDAKYKDGFDWIHRLFEKEDRENSSLNIPYLDDVNRPGNEPLYIPEQLIKYLPKEFILTRDNRVSRWTVEDLEILEIVTKQFREDAKVSLFLKKEEIQTKRTKFNNDYFTQMYGRQADRFDENLGYASSLNKDVRLNVNLAPENKFFHGQEKSNHTILNKIPTAIAHIQRASRFLDGQKEGLLYNFFVRELHNNYSLYYKNKQKRIGTLDAYILEHGLKINYLAEKIFKYNPSENIEIELTREQCLGVYIYSLNKHGLPKLMHVAGNGLSYKNINDIENLLTTKDKAFAHKLIELIGEGEYFENLKDVTYNVYNKILKKERNYFPLSSLTVEPEDIESSNKKIIGTTGQTQGFVDKGMTKERVDAIYPLDLDVISTFRSQVDAQERTIFFSQWVADANYYLGKNASVGQIISALYGDSWRDNMQNFVNNVAKTTNKITDIEKFANKILSTVSASKITYSLSAAMHQFASLGVAVRGDIDLDILMGVLLKINIGPMKKEMELLDPAMKNRVFNLEVSRFRDLAHTSKITRGIAKAVDNGMKVSEFTDSVVTTKFWWGVYKTQLRKGATEKEAIFRASQFISETQSSSNEMDLSEIQFGKTHWLRNLSRFKNDNFQKWNQLFFDLPFYLKSKQYSKVAGTVFSNLLSAAIFVGTTGIFLKAAGDDEKKFNEMFRVFLDAIYHQLIGDVIPLVGDDVSNAIEGFSFGSGEIALSALTPIFSLLNEIVDGDGDNEALADKSVNMVSELLGLMFGLPSVQGKRVYKAIKEKDALRLLGGYWASKE